MAQREISPFALRWLQFQEDPKASVITSQKAASSSSSSITTPPPPSRFLCSASSLKTVEVSLPPMKKKRKVEEAGNQSSKTRPPRPSPFPCLASSSKTVKVSLPPKKKRKVGLTTVKKAGESSFIICEICAETKRRDKMFRNKRCDHSFCSDCITKQVATKIQDGITVVPCLGLNCKGVLELDACRSMLPKEVIERWDDAMCEAFLLTAKKFYCPFKDCSAMMLDDNEEGRHIRESECPFCHRLFCARCHVPWHHGIGCKEFQKLNENEGGREDLLVRELANEKKWSRCPKCKFYVEKTGGCLHITCRCKFQFCYACGKEWSLIHSCGKRN